MCMPQRKWERFVRGTDDGEKDRLQVEGLCREVLLEYRREVERHIEDLGTVEGTESMAADLLEKRWLQIREILDANLNLKAD